MLLALLEIIGGVQGIYDNQPSSGLEEKKEGPDIWLIFPLLNMMYLSSDLAWPASVRLFLPAAVDRKLSIAVISKVQVMRSHSVSAEGGTGSGAL